MSRYRETCPCGATIDCGTWGLDGSVIEDWRNRHAACIRKPKPAPPPVKFDPEPMNAGRRYWREGA